MSLSTETHNKSSLAARYQTSEHDIRTRLKYMLTDGQIAGEFGAYLGRRFTPKQLEIIERELGTPPPTKKTA